jgi:hypothetical protein
MKLILYYIYIKKLKKNKKSIYLFIKKSHFDLDHHFINIPNFNSNDHSLVNYLFPFNLHPLFQSLSHFFQSLFHLF